MNWDGFLMHLRPTRDTQWTPKERALRRAASHSLIASCGSDERRIATARKRVRQDMQRRYAISRLNMTTGS